MKKEVSETLIEMQKQLLDQVDPDEEMIGMVLAVQCINERGQIFTRLISSIHSSQHHNHSTMLKDISKACAERARYRG